MSCNRSQSFNATSHLLPPHRIAYFCLLFAVAADTSCVLPSSWLISTHTTASITATKTTLDDLNYDVLQINFDEWEWYHKRWKVVLMSRKSTSLLKGLTLVNRRLASKVRPRLFKLLSVLYSYRFTVTILTGSFKAQPVHFATYARRFDVLSLTNTSTLKRMRAGY